MEKKKTIVRLMLAVVVGGLAVPAGAQTKDPPPPKTNTNQWTSMGGTLLLSGKYRLKKSWTTTSGDLLGKGLWWTGGFYLSGKKRKYVHWDPTVLNQVSPRVGTVTLQGPGTLVAFEMNKAAGLSVRDAKTNDTWRIVELGAYVSRGKWHQRNDHEPNSRGQWTFDPATLTTGRIPAGQTVTLNVYAYASCYDNRMNTGEISYYPPQSMDYELWYFKGKGGKIIKVTNLAPGPKKTPVSPGLKPTWSTDNNPPPKVDDSGLLGPMKMSGLQAGNASGSTEPPVQWQDKYDKLVQGGLKWSIVKRIMMEDEVREAADQNLAYVIEGNIWGTCELLCKGLEAGGQASNTILGSYVADMDPTGTVSRWSMGLDLAYTWTSSRQGRYKRNGDLSLLSGDDVPSVIMKYGENVAFGKLQKHWKVKPFSGADRFMKAGKILLDGEWFDPVCAKAHFAKTKQTYHSSRPYYVPGRTFEK